MSQPEKPYLELVTTLTKAPAGKLWCAVQRMPYKVTYSIIPTSKHVPAWQQCQVVRTFCHTSLLRALVYSLRYPQLRQQSSIKVQHLKYIPNGSKPAGHHIKSDYAARGCSKRRLLVPSRSLRIACVSCVFRETKRAGGSPRGCQGYRALSCRAGACAARWRCP